MSRSTISTFKLFELFPDEHSAREYLESRLWPDGARCPQCKSGDRLTKRTGGFYRCNACQFDFTIRTNTKGGGTCSKMEPRFDTIPEYAE